MTIENEFSHIFSVKTNNCLVSGGITTIAELIIQKESDLLQLPNLGKKSLCEIKDVLHDLGLCLGMSKVNSVIMEAVIQCPHCSKLHKARYALNKELIG